jgi:hypothetical protein
MVYTFCERKREIRKLSIIRLVDLVTGTGEQEENSAFREVQRSRMREV